MRSSARRVASSTYTFEVSDRGGVLDVDLVLSLKRKVLGSMGCFGGCCWKSAYAPLCKVNVKRASDWLLQMCICNVVCTSVMAQVGCSGLHVCS